MRRRALQDLNKWNGQPVLSMQGCSICCMSRILAKELLTLFVYENCWRWSMMGVSILEGPSQLMTCYYERSQNFHIRAQTSYMILLIKWKVTLGWSRSCMDMPSVPSSMKFLGLLHIFWQERSWESVILMKWRHELYPWLHSVARGFNSIGWSTYVKNSWMIVVKRRRNEKHSTTCGCYCWSWW